MKKKILSTIILGSIASFTLIGCGSEALEVEKSKENIKVEVVTDEEESKNKEKLDKIQIAVDEKDIEESKTLLNDIDRETLSDEEKVQVEALQEEIDLIVEGIELEKQREAERIVEEKRKEEERIAAEKKVEEEKRQAEKEKEEASSNKDNDFVGGNGTADHDKTSGYDSPTSGKDAVVNTSYGYIANGNKYIHKNSNCKFIRDKSVTKVKTSSSSRPACNCYHY